MKDFDLIQGTFKLVFNAVILLKKSPVYSIQLKGFPDVLIKCYFLTILKNGLYKCYILEV